MTSVTQRCAQNDDKNKNESIRQKERERDAMANRATFSSRIECFPVVCLFFFGFLVFCALNPIHEKKIGVSSTVQKKSTHISVSLMAASRRNAMGMGMGMEMGMVIGDGQITADGVMGLVGREWRWLKRWSYSALSMAWW